MAWWWIESTEDADVVLVLGEYNGSSGVLVDVVEVIGYEESIGMDDGKRINEKKKKTCENVCFKLRVDVRTSRIRPLNRGNGGFVMVIS